MHPKKRRKKFYFFLRFLSFICAKSKKIARSLIQRPHRLVYGTVPGRNLLVQMVKSEKPFMKLQFSFYFGQKLVQAIALLPHGQKDLHFFRTIMSQHIIHRPAKPFQVFPCVLHLLRTGQLLGKPLLLLSVQSTFHTKSVPYVLPLVQAYLPPVPVLPHA